MFGDNSDFARDWPHDGPAERQFARWAARLQVEPDFNTGVIAFAVGIGAYFALPQEPGVILVGQAILGFAVLWIVSSRKDFVGQGLVWIALLIALGFGRSLWHSAAAETPRLPVQEYTYRVEGWVSAIEKSGRSERYVIEVLDIERLSNAETPKRVRIRVTKAPDPPILAGDTINWLAAMKAPPGPVVPGGYDPAQAAYFKGIGGYGFGYGAPRQQGDAELGLVDSTRRAIVRWRFGLADRVMAVAPAETAGLQAALMTGVRRYIPEEQTENLRVAGLAHILAISGLHMGLLAGGTFTVMTLLLACILPLSRRYDVRKPAAVIGIIAATAYLVLSGASVATQRAWVMAVIVFLAVILDRRAVSMRSVCVAALLTLTLHPESLISVGFQMSFAAVAALVLTYQYWQSIRPVYVQPTRFRRGVNFFTSLSVTSLVAGFATGGFALFHFNRFAKYGFIGNLLAMPLFSLAVMPLAVISLLAIPLGLERVPLWLMGQAMEPILAAAGWVAGWPGAMAYIPAPPDWVLPVYGLGFAIICIARRWMKLAGLLMMLMSFAGWNSADVPDLRISEDGKVAFWQMPDTGEGDPILLVDSRRPDRYGRDQFAQRAGFNDVDWLPFKDSLAQCDALACRARIGAWQISILQSPSEVPAECETSDLVILSVRRAGPVARRNCDSVLIDETTLWETGALDVYLKDTLTTKAARRPEGQRRLWHNP